MGSAKDKHILVSQNPNLIPDFVELVAKGLFRQNLGESIISDKWCATDAEIFVHIFDCCCDL
jgi:hypothetical protein